MQASNGVASTEEKELISFFSDHTREEKLSSSQFHCPIGDNGGY